MSEPTTIDTARGVRMPRILYGTAWKEQRTAACVERALGLGFRGIDTACQPKHYHEPGVGEGMAAFLASPLGRGCTREDFYVQTKFTSLAGQDPRRVPYDVKAPLEMQVAQSLETSLRNLRVAQLDCVVLHAPLERFQDTLTVWRALEEACDRGLVRQLGLSNCYEPDLFARICQAARIPPSVLQNRFYARTHYDRALRAQCRARQVVYQSFWTLSANPHILGHEALKSLCAKYGRAPAQIFFRYLTQVGIQPLTGTQSSDHMREALSIFDFTLDAAECAAIAALHTA